MKLYWHKFSIIPWRVRIALHDKALRWEEVRDTGSLLLPGEALEIVFIKDLAG
jgi:hypothetical protein